MDGGRHYRQVKICGSMIAWLAVRRVEFPSLHIALGFWHAASYVDIYDCGDSRDF